MAETTFDIEMTADAHGFKRGDRMSVGELRCIRWCDIQNVAKRVGKSRLKAPRFEAPAAPAEKTEKEE